MKWIRLWTEEIFYGTTFQELNVTERGVWFSLLVLAGLGKSHGIVELRRGIGYPLSTLAVLINCEEKLLKKTLNKLCSVSKIKILKDKRIKITKWNKYQTRYEKYYKQRKEESLLKKDGIDMPKIQPTERSADECTTELEVEEDKNKPSSPKLKFTDEDMKLVDELDTLIIDINPKHIFSGGQRKEKWANVFRLMRERDNLTLENIRATIKFAFEDAFWSTVIQSASNLREHYNKLQAKKLQKRANEKKKRSKSASERPL